MRLSVLAVILILFSVSALQAQARKIVLLEEATSATCNPCALYNPGLQSFLSKNLGGIISVRYHAWWPNATPLDPMYLLNTTDNRNRIYYYSINSVPTYVLDGTKYGGPSDTELIRSQMLERMREPAPAEIYITTDRGYDSLRTQIEVVPQFDPGVSNLVLRAAIIERLVTYVNAPGTNGEKQFGDVMRKMLPDGDGSPITGFKVGDTLRFAFTQAVDPDWIPEDLSVVAWLQNEDTKEILQANIDFPTSVIESNDKSLDILSPDTTITRNFKIVNHNREALELEVSVSRLKNPDSWQYTLIGPDGPGNTIPAQVEPGDSLQFSLEITAAAGGSLELDLYDKNLNDPGFYGEGYGYGFTYRYQAVVPYNRDVLLVDDDGGEAYQQGFEDILNMHQYSYLTMDPTGTAALAKEMDLSAFKLIIWNVSWATPVWTAGEIDLLKDYLDAGGSLLVLGQDVGWDIFDAQGNSNFAAAKDFYHNYLGADYISDNSEGTSLTGQSGDPIGDGMSFSLGRPYGFSNFFPEEIAAYQNKAQPVFFYNNEKIGAVRYDAGTFRTVYTGFGLEQINGDENKELFLTRVCDWAGVTTTISDASDALPKKLTLEQNYPNPFNPRTQIRYHLVNNSPVRLSVYDALGRHMVTLVDGRQSAGTHHISLDGSGWSSGIYWYRLQAGDQVLVRKMLFVK